MKIVCVGPGPRFKGGIANYNTSLAKALDRRDDCTAEIVSWTQQYPAIIPREFVDRSSRTDQLAGTGIRVHYLLNYNNPLSWARTYRKIVALRPDRVVIQWAITIQALPLGYLARRLAAHPDIEVVFDLHNVGQKERSALDTRLTRYGLGVADRYLTHARMTADELRVIFPDRPLRIRRLYHPIYDLFAPDPDFDAAARKRELGLRRHVFLFFGFIRKYKGLHDAIRAFARLAAERDDVSLLICGESFWNTLDASSWATRAKNAVFGLAKRVILRRADDERSYQPLALIEELGLADRCVVVNEFIPTEDVHQYYQMADALLLPYSYATPSGVESIAHNFALPVIANRVGHFAETIRDGYNGYLAAPGDVADLARQMQRMLDRPIPRAHVRETTAALSWDNYAAAVVEEE